MCFVIRRLVIGDFQQKKNVVYSLSNEKMLLEWRRWQIEQLSTDGRSRQRRQEFLNFWSF